MGLNCGPSLRLKVTGWRSREAPEKPRDDHPQAVGNRSLARRKRPGSALRLRPQPLQAPPQPLQAPPLPARPACLGICRAEGTKGNRSCRFAQSPGAWDRDAVPGKLLASPARASAQPAGPWQPPRSGAVAEQPLSPPPGSAPLRPRLRSSFRPEAEATAGPELQARPLARYVGPFPGPGGWRPGQSRRGPQLPCG